MMSIGPRDEIEGMLAGQLLACHHASMECFRRAMIGEQTFEGRRDALSQPTNYGASYATLLDALNRHRGKGQQKVTVEHVHVHAGGQAVVGMVQPPGGGAQSKLEDQGHAKQIAHPPEQEVRRPNEERKPVSVAGDAQRPMPNARRPV